MAGAMLVAAGGMLEEAGAGVAGGMEEEAMVTLVVPGVPETEGMLEVTASGVEARTLVIVGNVGAVIMVGATKPLLAAATALAKPNSEL